MKSPKNNSGEVISRRTGIIIFCGVTISLIVLFFFFMPRSAYFSSAEPTPSPTPSLSITPSPEPSLNTELVEGSLAEINASRIAMILSSRNWQATPSDMMSILEPSISSGITSSTRDAVDKLDWSGCLKAKCRIIPEAGGASSVSANGGKEIIVSIRVTPYLNDIKALPVQIWNITMTLESDEQWRATKILGPGFP